MVSVNNERSVSIRYLWDYVPLVSTCVFFYEKIHKISSDPSLSIDPERVRLIKWAKPRRIIAALPLILNNFVVVFVDIALYLIDPPRGSRKRKLRLSPIVSESTLLNQRRSVRQRIALVQSPRSSISLSSEENIPPRAQPKKITRDRKQLARCLQDPEAHVRDGAGLGLGYNSEEEIVDEDPTYHVEESNIRPFRLPETKNGELIDETIFLEPSKYTLDPRFSGRKIRKKPPLNSIRIDRKYPDQGAFSQDIDEKKPLRGQ